MDCHKKVNWKLHIPFCCKCETLFITFIYLFYHLLKCHVYFHITIARTLNKQISPHWLNLNIFSELPFVLFALRALPVFSAIKKDETTSLFR